MGKTTGANGFPNDFMWGVATASYQVEGAVSVDGRGPSIWDSFSHTPGKVLHGHTGDRSVDQYHRYDEDVRLIREAGLDAYRFSIAWPRVVPSGTGSLNVDGIDYYKRLIDELRRSEISPVATLYHWDLPQPLEDAGGWPHRDTAYRFAEYAAICFRELGDVVDMWITLNEPWCSSVLGYGDGEHAPGRTDTADAWAAGHHLLLGHGLAVEAYRAESASAPIGITLNLSTPRAATRRPADLAAADRATDLQTRFFLDPLFGFGYPERHFEAWAPAVPPPIVSGDLEIIASPIDFLGLNYYTEYVIADAPTGNPETTVDGVAAHPEGYREVPSYQDKTAMGWTIVPRGLYRQLCWVWEHIGGRVPLYITENGCAVDDRLSSDGLRCHDERRIDYLREHFAAAQDAIAEGVDLRGFFVWSLIDNFEWAWGYERRFGIVYADYLDGRRVPKDSYYFVRDVVSGAE